jgi:hypothetical protein
VTVHGLGKLLDIPGEARQVVAPLDGGHLTHCALRFDSTNTPHAWPCSGLRSPVNFRDQPVTVFLNPPPCALAFTRKGPASLPVGAHPLRGYTGRDRS